MSHVDIKFVDLETYTPTTYNTRKVIQLKAQLLLCKSVGFEYEVSLTEELCKIYSRHHSFEMYSKELVEQIEVCLDYLRSLHRIVNFKHEDPAMWITTRSGGPRYHTKVKKISWFS